LRCNDNEPLEQGRPCGNGLSRDWFCSIGAFPVPFLSTSGGPIMFPHHNRRRFLQTAGTAGALLGLDGLSLLTGLRPVSAADARVDPGRVRLDTGIEPLVELIEETPRERLLEEVGARVRKGLSYRDLLTALFLAGVRNIRPRPNVGFKFHAVLVVHSAHLASLAAPDNERWLPLFWSLDSFKAAQATNEKESGWRLGPVDETNVPTARKARQQFIQAMDDWDEGAADVAAAALARTAGANEAFELFCLYGARDFRDIGHKAIYVSNAWRTLECIGWHHAEPVLRSLAYALLQHEGSSPAKRDAAPDQPGRRNRTLAGRLRPEWQEGKISPDATVDLLTVLREGKSEAAADCVAKLLDGGAAVQSVWDALFAGAAELVIRQPGIPSLHAVTSTNALRHAFEMSGNDQTRRWLLLQNAAFLPLFREFMGQRGKLGDTKIDGLQSVALKSPGPEAVGEIFGDVGPNSASAAGKVLTYLAAKGDPAALMDAARLLVFFKGTDAHDYKFSSAVIEDYARISPPWRERYLASSAYLLRGASARDSGLAKRTHTALKNG
jgi:hypothetical protein